MSIKHGKIGEFAKRVKVGFVGTCEKYYTEDKRYPMIRTTNLTETGIDYSDLKYVTEEFYDKNKKSQLHDGDVLIARFGTSGTACVYHGGDAQCLNAIIVEPDIETTIPEYLAIVVNSRSVRDQVNKRIVGSTQAILNTKVLSDIEISLPSLEEQRKVVEIFQSLQKICIQRNKELLTLDNLIKARFVELFGDVITNDRGWAQQIFENITESRLGKMLDAKKQTGEHAYPYLANFNVQWFTFNTDNLNEMDFDEKDRKEFELQEGDLLVCEGGEIGRCAIWHNEIQPCYFQKALHRVRCKKEYVIPEYLAWWFKYNCEHGGFSAIEGAKATISHLPGAKLKKLNVTVPEMKRQEEFAVFIDQVDKSKAAVQKSLDETQKLFDSLMQGYFG